MTLVCSLIFQVSITFISHAIISVGLVYLLLTSLTEIPSAAAFQRASKVRVRDWEFII